MITATGFPVSIVPGTLVVGVAFVVVVDADDHITGVTCHSTG
jgi:hypothetical protein